MSQAEVAEWLKANPGWHKPDEVAVATGKNVRAIRDNLRRLGTWGEAAHRPGAHGSREWSAI